MEKPPVPYNEKERLALLRSLELLDTPPEAIYDDIVKIAASLSGSKFAAFSLIDKDRQWFKAKVGMDIEETPRDLAFCAYTIQDTQPIVIENTLEDHRFSDHPSVVGDSHIRAYAGFPVQGGANKTIIGSLCIYHDEPLTLNKGQVRTMELLVKQIEEHLKYRHIAKELVSINQKKDRLQTDLKKVLEEKDRFLAHLSHEIRNPLNAVMGLVDLLGETPMDEYQMEVLDQLYHSQEFLLHLLNDILDFSKINARKVKLRTSDVLLNDLVQEIISLYRPRAFEKKLDLSYQIDADIESLSIDKTRMKQVLGNLIFNAIKFTDNGFIKLTVKEKEDQMIFSIKDTGIGIQKDFKEKIFSHYAQDDNYQKIFHGTGLGLSISKSLVELMGGTIQFKSPIFEGDRPYGPGSIFYFSIPKTTPPTNAKSAANRLAPLDILVVDDDKLATELMVRKLAKLHHKVTEVNRGKEALKLLEEKDFDLIILDSKMPIMDGRDIFRHIRNIKKDNIPVIICSGYTHEEFRKSYRKIGDCQFLTKPFLTDQLQDAMAQAFNKQRERSI